MGNMQLFQEFGKWRRGSHSLHVHTTIVLLPTTHMVVGHHQSFTITNTGFTLLTLGVVMTLINQFYVHLALLTRYSTLITILFGFYMLQPSFIVSKMDVPEE
jgi:membrane-bound ClpP family serine protease